MKDLIVKICKNCGPLTIDKVSARTRSYKGEIKNEINCKICARASFKRSYKKNEEKHKARRIKNRYIDRPLDIKELKCSKCKLIKSIDDFNRHMLNIRYPYCRDCRILSTKNHHDKEESKKKHREWYQKNYEPLSRSAQYMKKYGITLQQFEELSEKQNNVCLICNKPETYTKRKDGKCFLHVDHCHKTGKVRGLLCLRCNVALGNFLDSKELLLGAIAYLEKNS